MVARICSPSTYGTAVDLAYHYKSDGLDLILQLKIPGHFKKMILTVLFLLKLSPGWPFFFSSERKWTFWSPKKFVWNASVDSNHFTMVFFIVLPCVVTIERHMTYGAFNFSSLNFTLTDHFSLKFRISCNVVLLKDETWSNFRVSRYIWDMRTFDFDWICHNIILHNIVQW